MRSRHALTPTRTTSTTERYVHLARVRLDGVAEASEARLFAGLAADDGATSGATAADSGSEEKKSPTLAGLFEVAGQDLNLRSPGYEEANPRSPAPSTAWLSDVRCSEMASITSAVKRVGLAANPPSGCARELEPRRRDRDEGARHAVLPLYPR
jgi:hypothetical protein